MIILAIDTSGKTASCALATKDKILAQFTISNGLTHSETLMPMIEQMLAISGISKHDVGLLACSSGPGSFTGLRIGAACAKGLAMGLGLKIVPVSSLYSLAYNIYQTNCAIIPIMDARRDEVYTAIYGLASKEIQTITPPTVCSIEEILQKAAELGKRAVFLGDGTFVHGDKILAHGFEIAPPHKLLQSAASVAMAAFDNIENAVSITDFELEYIRLSQAERELIARG
ncbi:MAG: tRNA (adenosine(37)-N6)-threonylcarbamoyltransferase complex dimerization subunit type 1 TsaB [Defluviitaleaceae bacterium]|nr:tRNA (adenosine(37)-N6)-threonylcarbamoyltransferase complex dimerization subunit type 1 TsaB [Defluviitaleaceae bacterium]